MIWSFTKAGVWGFKPFLGCFGVHRKKRHLEPTCVVPVHVFPTGEFQELGGMRMERASYGQMANVAKHRERRLRELRQVFHGYFGEKHRILMERSGEPGVRPLGSNNGKQWWCWPQMTFWVCDLYMICTLLSCCLFLISVKMLSEIRSFICSAACYFQRLDLLWWNYSCVELRSSHFPRSVVQRSTRRSHPISDSDLVLTKRNHRSKAG